MTVFCICCGRCVPDGNFKDFYRDGYRFVTNDKEGRRVVETLEDFTKIRNITILIDADNKFSFRVICPECIYKDNLIFGTYR